MKNIKCLTYPRSGHHLLVKCLLKYFAADPYHLDDLFSKDTSIYLNVLSGGNLHYCETYMHCNGEHFPNCTDPKTNFIKCHDLHGEVEPNPTHNYLVQYRYPVESMVSFYKWRDWEEDTQEQWEVFAIETLKGWKAFIQKWVIQNKLPNIHFVPYENLIDNPKETLKGIITFMGGLLNESLLDDVIKTVGIIKRNNIKDFKYYNVGFYQYLCYLAKTEMEALGYENFSE